MKLETRPFDAANYLNGPEDEADLLSDALADGDPRYVAAALGAVARAQSREEKPQRSNDGAIEALS